MCPTYPEALLLLEPVNTPAEEILPWAENSAAVHRYLDCLRRGWLGQALGERYSFDDTPDTPTGMLRTNSIQSDETFAESLKPIDDQIRDDLRESIEGNSESIPLTRDTFSKGLENTDDPGLDLLRALIEMMEVGLETMPKILVTVLDFDGAVIKSDVDVPWHYGLEDAISRLSAKIMDEAVLDMVFKKSGRDIHVSCRIDNRQGNAAAMALVEELTE